MAEKIKKKYTYGDLVQQRIQRVFELLLDCAFQEIVLEPKETCTKKLTRDTPQYKFEVTKKGLIAVAQRKRWKNGGGWEFGDEKDQRWKNEIYPALSHYLGDKFLGILEGGGQQGSSEWSFTLRLWHSDKSQNLELFTDKWREANQAGSQPAIPQAKKVDQGINWRSACEVQLEEEWSTISPLSRKTIDLDGVHVALELVERKERLKVDRAQEIKPERWAQKYTKKRVEHNAFLAEIGKRQPGEHVVILGEPGAGKTTLLMKVWKWLLEQEPEEDIIVAWVPLAAVKNNELEEYLHKAWIKKFCKSGEIDRYWASFEALADAGRVWLLLDGADAMGGEALSNLDVALREFWARSTRAIITCRLNLWDASANNKLQTSLNFQVYRTLDFQYENPVGQDEVKDFIDNWFLSTNEPEAGQSLRDALGKRGKERIKDLAQNPLRLSLLCDIWEEGGVLPDTQTDLYQKFVNYFYKWNESPELLNQREQLNQSMQSLAKYGLNKPSLRFRLSEAELQQQIEEKHLKALKKLGWLKYVGVDETEDDVHVFLHPTFQEYFAACSIDDWDYFLPRAHADRPVPCLGEIVPTYRVFAKQWEQIILFWFGRRDLKDDPEETDKEKEGFLDKLTNFQAGCGDSPHHYFLAYRIAAIGIGEFKSSRKAQLIVDQIVEFAFERFNSVTSLEWLRDSAKAAIYLTDRSCVVKSLQSFLSHPDLDDERCSNDVRNALDRITTKSRQEEVGDFCFQQCMDKYKPIVSYRMPSLNQRQILDAITTLGKPIEKRIDNNPFKYLLPSHHNAISTLRRAKADEPAIKALIAFLARALFPDGHGLGFLAAEALGEIAKRNEQAIEDLIDLLKDNNVKCGVCFNVFMALHHIVTGSEMPLAIHNLKEYTTIESNELNFHRFKYCGIIIFQYTQVLSYSEFYEAWHHFPPSDAY